MTMGIVLEETMSGWIRIDGKQQPFSFTIRAFTAHIFSLTAPREFRGVAKIGIDEVPVTGVLTIRVTGPRYELDIDHPKLGALHIEGEKSYSANPAKLVASLVTCPLAVYRNGQPVGDAEVVYRDSMIAFPFKALRLVSEEKAYGAYSHAR
ncbi:MAG: hypothetical protein ACOY33_07330 [Pseudomonadota bacterium]